MPDEDEATAGDPKVVARARVEAFEPKQLELLSLRVEERRVIRADDIGIGIHETFEQRRAVALDRRHVVFELREHHRAMEKERPILQRCSVRTRERRFHVCEDGARFRKLPFQHDRPRLGELDARMILEHAFGNARGTLEQTPELPVVEHPMASLVENACGEAEIVCRDRMLEGIVVQSGRRKPSAASRVDRERAVGIASCQFFAQKLGEEMVVAIPTSFAIQREDKQPATLDLVDERARVRALRHGIAQLG